MEIGLRIQLKFHENLMKLMKLKNRLKENTLVNMNIGIEKILLILWKKNIEIYSHYYYYYYYYWNE